MLWLSDHNPNGRHGFDHWDAIEIADATCFPHLDSILIGKVTSRSLQVQSRTARAHFQRVQFAHDNPPNDRWLLACNDEIDHFIIDTVDDTDTS